MLRIALICAITLFSACTQDNPKAEIHALLQARNQSISQQDIQQYTALLDSDYAKTQGKDTITQMKAVFSRFEKVDMQSRDATIHLLDPNHAICEQTYVLKVYADGAWRKIVQREQLTLTKRGNQWKISGGL